MSEKAEPTAAQTSTKADSSKSEEASLKIAYFRCDISSGVTPKDC